MTNRDSLYEQADLGIGELNASIDKLKGCLQAVHGNAKIGANERYTLELGLSLCDAAKRLVGSAQKTIATAKKIGDKSSQF